MAEPRRAEDEMEKLPTLARVMVRVLFREGPVVIAFLVMLAVILGLIPSPYLGKPLEALLVVHQEQSVILEQIRDDLKKWHSDEQRRTR